MKKPQIFIGCLLLILPAGLALAHATPLSYDPDGSQVLQSQPAQVSIRFSERVEPNASSITVFAPDGSAANVGSGQLDPKDAHVFSVGLKNGGQGTYTVSWQVVSADDGHFTKGAYVFSVGQASSAAQQPQQSGFQIQHSSSLPEGTTIGLELLGMALLLGLLAVLAFIWRPMRRKYFVAETQGEGVDNVFAQRLNWFLISGFLLIVLGTVSYLIFKSNELKNLQSIAFSQSFRVFISTVSARWTAYRLLSAIIFFIVFWFNRSKILASEKITKIEIFLFLLLDFNAFARARVSHAAASSFHPAISVIINFFHLYFKDLWVGGILALVFLLAPVIKKLKNLRPTLFLLSAFSRVTAVALAVGGVCGVYVIWLHLKGFGNILTTDWGDKFVILSLFAGLLVLARLFHMFWVEPALAKAIEKGEPKLAERPLWWLKFSLPFEAAMGIFILLVTAVLIITTPPIAPHYNFQRQAQSQGAQISLSQDVYESNKFLVEITGQKTKKDLAINNLIVTLTNSEKSIGPITVAVEERFVGGYVFDQSLLSPPGKWQVDITAQRDNAFDAVASFSLNYPDEINFAKAHAQDRSFGLFEILNLFMCVVILAVAWYFYRRAGKLRQVAITGRGAVSARSLATPWAWPLPLILGFGLIFALSTDHLHIIEGTFQRECEKNQNLTFFAWHESVPERAGAATSDLALPGCMVGVGLGQFHFASEKEFLYFTRPAEAQVSLHTDPPAPVAGQPVTFNFAIKDFAGNPVTDLSLDHDRILHTIVASADFSVFSHIHVEDSGPVTADVIKNAEFPVHYTFPKAGRYLVAIDFTVRAKPFSQTFYLNVAGTPTQGQAQADFSQRKQFGVYDVSFTAPKNIKSGRPVTINYHVTAENQPVLDMQPYLSVPMHISVISDDLIHYVHIHGLLPLGLLDKFLGTGIHAQHAFLPDKFGPDITASVTFPAPGTYHIFGEFKRNGAVVPTDFMVKVN